MHQPAADHRARDGAQQHEADIVEAQGVTQHAAQPHDPDTDGDEQHTHEREGVPAHADATHREQRIERELE